MADKYTWEKQIRQASIDGRIASRSDRQQGNITTEQLTALGLRRSGIAYRARIGRLHRVYNGVYGVGRPPRTALEYASAAVLACGPEAALSHRSALALWGLGRWPQRPHVTVRGNRRPAGINAHRSRVLLRRDFRTHQGIRATSPARTLLDCAPGLNDKALARAVNDARLKRLVRPQDLADVANRFPHHRGARRLKPYVEATGGPTRSDWERAFPVFCRRYGLPEPVMNARVAGHEVDALFPDAKLIVELDGWAYHSTRESFEGDRDRDADALAAGHNTVRLTWERMHRSPAKEAARLEQILRWCRRQAE